MKRKNGWLNGRTGVLAEISGELMISGRANWRTDGGRRMVRRSGCTDEQCTDEQYKSENILFRKHILKKKNWLIEIVSIRKKLIKNLNMPTMDYVFFKNFNAYFMFNVEIKFFLF